MIEQSKREQEAFLTLNHGETWYKVSVVKMEPNQIITRVLETTGNKGLVGEELTIKPKLVNLIVPSKDEPDLLIRLE